jgi:hypothetical protein
MRRNLAALLGSDTRAADLCVNGDSWRVHIFGIAVIGRNAFVQVALVGPTNRTATVRIAARFVAGVTGRQILDSICDWLASGDARSHGYLDARAIDSCPPVETNACAVAMTAR